tara:strand:- start:1295 stop:1606 length:312 start_codon:yes stop_codon:yes gene_type:complete
MSKKKYYQNNWKKIQSTPDKYFESIDFDDFMDWKIGGYELPVGVVCLIRERNLKTNKIKEYAYKQLIAARKKSKKIAVRGDSEMTICTHNEVAHVEPFNYIGD